MGIYVGDKRYAPYIGDKRRRYIGEDVVPISNPYITDGLIYQHDGEYNNGFGVPHETNINYWKDIVSGTNILTLSGTLQWGDKYCYFDGNTYIAFTALGTNIVSAIKNNTIYIEMILEPVSHGSQSYNGYIAFGQNNRGVWLWDDATKQYSAFSYRTNGYTNIYLYEWSGQKKINRITLSPNKVEIDGNTYTSNNNLNVGSNDCYIGNLPNYGRPNYGRGVFKLYSLRVYNRVLSSEEIAANYAIDQQRFGLT